MSLKSWLKEFYPKAASRTRKQDALNHSIRKWKGFRKTSLKRHAVVLKGFGQVMGRTEAGEAMAGQTTCALCTHYFDTEPGKHACRACPLYKANASNPCTGSRRAVEIPPYSAFLYDADPRPMLKLLYKAKRMLLAAAKRKKRS